MKKSKKSKKRKTAPKKTRTTNAPRTRKAATPKAGGGGRALTAAARAITAAPSVGSIKADVSQILSSVSPRPPDPLAPCMSLEFELKLSDDIKRALSNSFQKIARQSNPAARISDDECGDLDVVEDAWVLVVEKSGLSLDKECK